MTGFWEIIGFKGGSDSQDSGRGFKWEENQYSGGVSNGRRTSIQGSFKCEENQDSGKLILSEVLLYQLNVFMEYGKTLRNL